MFIDKFFKNLILDLKHLNDIDFEKIKFIIKNLLFKNSGLN